MATRRRAPDAQIFAPANFDVSYESKGAEHSHVNFLLHFYAI